MKPPETTFEAPADGYSLPAPRLNARQEYARELCGWHERKLARWLARSGIAGDDPRPTYKRIVERRRAEREAERQGPPPTIEEALKHAGLEPAGRREAKGR